jgi:hypothetical protein
MEWKKLTAVESLQWDNNIKYFTDASGNLI